MPHIQVKPGTLPTRKDAKVDHVRMGMTAGLNNKVLRTVVTATLTCKQWPKDKTMHVHMSILKVWTQLPMLSSIILRQRGLTGLSLMVSKWSRSRSIGTTTTFVTRSKYKKYQSN